MKMNAKLLNRLNRSHCSEVGLAELFTALEMLKPSSSEACSLIAKTLGLEWRESEEKVTSYPDSSSKSNVEPSGSVDEELTTELEMPDKTPGPQSSTELEPIGYEDQMHEILFNDPILEDDDIDELRPTDIALHMKSPKYQPLLRDEWFRGLMSAMLATPRASRDIDLRVLEKRLANGQPLERLPWRQQSTLEHGVQLYLDRSDSMQPFWHDEKGLINRLQRLLGSRNVQVRWLEIYPWVSTESQLKWHSPPPSQFPTETPLLIVSDFGIGERLFGEGVVGLEPWFPLLDLAQSHNCPVIALVPAPESFWPNKLKQLIPNAFVWDHDTSIQSVRRWQRRIH